MSTTTVSREIRLASRPNGWPTSENFATAERAEVPTICEQAADAAELLRRERRLGTSEGSVLCAPLMQGGTIVGVIQLENRVATGVFTDRQLVVVETLCAQAAVSLHNARLFEEQRAQADSFLRFVPRPFLEQLGRLGYVEGHNIVHTLDTRLTKMRFGVNFKVLGGDPPIAQDLLKEVAIFPRAIARHDEARRGRGADNYEDHHERHPDRDVGRPRDAGVDRLIGDERRRRDRPQQRVLQRVRADASWRWIEMATGHDPMVSHPRALAEHLLTCL